MEKSEDPFVLDALTEEELEGVLLGGAWPNLLTRHSTFGLSSWISPDKLFWIDETLSGIV